MYDFILVRYHIYNSFKVGAQKTRKSNATQHDLSKIN